MEYSLWLLVYIIVVSGKQHSGLSLGGKVQIVVCVCVCVLKMMINYWGAPMHFWDPKYDWLYAAT